MKNDLTPAQVARRFAEINERKPEKATAADLRAIAAAEQETEPPVSLEEFKKSLEGYSGRIALRIPRSLHKALKEAAAAEGVSLNQYMIYKLSRPD